MEETTIRPTNHKNNLTIDQYKQAMQGHATAQVEVSPDGMSAYITLSPPQGNGKPITEEEIYRQLAAAGVTKGIKKEYVYRLANFAVYHNSFTIAEGQEPKPGQNASITPHFERIAEPSSFSTPEDYAQIAYVSVKKGECLADLVPATAGTDGWNVLGEPIKCTDGLQLENVCGQHTYLEGTSIYAACDGLVCERAGAIHVYDAMTVDEVSDRKVEFDGIIFVEGNVDENSEIEAAGDIIIKGAVHQATLTAGGNVIIGKGINGKSSRIRAKGNVRSYFIEGTNVHADGNITANIVMRAALRCGGSLILSGNHENLIGGTCSVGGEVLARNIGSSAAVQTELSLESQYLLKQEKQDVMERIQKCNSAKAQLMTMLKGVDNDPGTRLSPIVEARKQIEEELLGLTSLLETLRQKEQQLPGAKITVKGKLYPNVSLQIDGVYYRNEDIKTFCLITKEGGGIVFSPALHG